MACFHPVRGFMSHRGKQLKFTPCAGTLPIGQPMMTVPCGRCIGCREHYSKMWAIRCSHELKDHVQSCFLTLTYSPENLPKDGSLQIKHLQDFQKRLRDKFKNKKIRFFSCGEYGEKLSRPHYHLLVFGHQFDDIEKLTSVLSTSPILSKLWKHGFHSIGEANFQTAAYIARYVTKKINGDQAHKHYSSVDQTTGEIITKRGEFLTMSLKPGIGASFYEKYKNDIYPADEIIHDGRPYAVPKYYDILLKRDNPDLYDRVKKARVDNFKELDPKDFHWRKLIVKEKNKQAKIALHLKRKYENDK